MLLMGCQRKASLPYGCGNTVPVYLWKSIDELYHKLPFLPILVFSFLALHKTCKEMRKDLSGRGSKNLATYPFQMLDRRRPTIIFALGHKF